MSEVAGAVRRHGRRAVPLVLLLVAAGCGPRLHVEQARIVPDPGAPMKLTLEAHWSGLTIDPRRPVRLHLGDGVRWLNLRPVEGTTDVWALEAPDHGYRLRLDVARRHADLVEPAYPPEDEAALSVALGQGPKRACTRIWFVPAGDGWTFEAGAQKQEPCK